MTWFQEAFRAGWKQGMLDWDNDTIQSEFDESSPQRKAWADGYAEAIKQASISTPENRIVKDEISND